MLALSVRAFTSKCFPNIFYCVCLVVTKKDLKFELNLSMVSEDISCACTCTIAKYSIIVVVVIVVDIRIYGRTYEYTDSRRCL